MKRLWVMLCLAVSSAHAANLTPILMSNGEARMVCDGQMRFMNTVELTGQSIVKAYLFGNLVTHERYGADVVIWSPAYWSAHPQSQWAPIGDLHIFSKPVGHNGGRQGESERSFSPDGIEIYGPVHIAAICWGGGTIEIYGAIWVREKEQK